MSVAMTLMPYLKTCPDTGRFARHAAIRMPQVASGASFAAHRTLHVVIATQSGSVHLLPSLASQEGTYTMGIIAWIIIGIVAGWLAEQIMGRNHGLITNLIVGVIGALIGGFVANALGFAWGGWIGSTIVATIGAIILLFLLGLVKRRA